MSIDLQQARKEAADRFYAIGMAELPEGYTYRFRKSLTGKHWGHKRYLEGPKPVTRKALYIWLHECAHARLGHSHNGRTPRHVEEMEAEQWAHQTMRNAGIPVPKAMTERAKEYVARKIRQAGPRAKINPQAKAFARSKL